MRPRTPLPFKPFTGISSSGKPAAGTARTSMPCAVPMNKTSVIASRLLNSCATASPGKRCPPVPPPATITRTSFSPARQSEQHSRLDQVHHHRGAAVADERQHEPFGREEPHDDAHVNQRLKPEERREPERQILAERLLDPAREPETAHDDHGEKRQHAECAEESHLLADDGEDKIRVSFGEIKHFLPALAEAAAEQLAGAECAEESHLLADDGEDKIRVSFGEIKHF